MSGAKRDEVLEGWRKVRNDELRNFLFTPNIVRIISRMRWADHVALMGNEKYIHNLCWGA
jgi:hypothetical protein